MGVGNVWSRALVYFGIVEEDEYWDEEAYAAEEGLERTYAERENANVRRLAPRRGGGEFEDWSEPSVSQGRTAVLRPGRRPPGGRSTAVRGPAAASGSDQSSNSPPDRRGERRLTFGRSL